MIYLIRESKHCGLSLALGSVRFFSIDIDIRSLADYLTLKAQGTQGLAKDLKWLYAYVDPHLLRKLKPNEFVLLSRKGGIGYGVFPFHEWHKKEREDILTEVGLKVDYGEVLEMPMSRGAYQTVGDREHAEIIRLRIEEDRSIHEIAEKLDRSSRTPHEHIKAHDKSISRIGFCASCKRFGSPYQDVKAEKGG